jgi:hypothetical protein
VILDYLDSPPLNNLDRIHQWEEELEEGELNNFVPKSTKLKNDEQLIFLFCQPTSILCVILAHTLLPHLRIFVSLPEPRHVGSLIICLRSHSLSCGLDLLASLVCMSPLPHSAPQRFMSQFHLFS